MADNLEAAIAEAGNPHTLLWESQAPPAVVPRVVPEFTNWRDEQLAWRRTAVLFDQSHHMADLNIKGPDALKLISDLAINSVEHFPVDMAKQFVAVNHDGYVIGDNILFHLDDDEYQAVGIPPSINWMHFHAATGDYDVRVWRDDNSLYRPSGDPVVYRYQVQGPGAMEVIQEATGEPAPKLKFFYMTHLTIGGKDVRALRHGMAGEPGFEMWGPWEDAEIVRDALLAAGAKYNLTPVGGRAYHTNALESGWLPRPLPAIYTGEKLADYRRWLTVNAYETTSPLGGSYNTGDIEDYYVTPYDLGYGRSVAFDHEFIGRAALEAHAANPQRQKVTLVWSPDDVAAAQRSMLEPGTPAKYIDFPKARYGLYQVDRVLVGGVDVGISHDAGYITNEQVFASLASIDNAHAAPGTQVEVVWGEEPNSAKPAVEPHRQVRIRATVEPAPYSRFARENYRSDAS